MHVNRHYSAKFHMSQTLLDEKTQVFWLHKILLKTCFHGYWACSVSKSAIIMMTNEQKGTLGPVHGSGALTTNS